MGAQSRCTSMTTGPLEVSRLTLYTDGAEEEHPASIADRAAPQSASKIPRIVHTVCHVGRFPTCPTQALHLERPAESFVALQNPFANALDFGQNVGLALADHIGIIR